MPCTAYSPGPRAAAGTAVALEAAQKALVQRMHVDVAGPRLEDRGTGLRAVRIGDGDHPLPECAAAPGRRLAFRLGRQGDR